MKAAATLLRSATSLHVHFPAATAAAATEGALLPLRRQPGSRRGGQRLRFHWSCQRLVHHLTLRAEKEGGRPAGWVGERQQVQRF